MEVSTTIVFTCTVVTDVLGHAHNHFYDDLDQELNAILENHANHLYDTGDVVSHKMKR